MKASWNVPQRRGGRTFGLLLLAGTVLACGTAPPPEPTTTPRVADEAPEALPRTLGRAPIEGRVAGGRTMACALSSGSVYCWGGRGRDPAPRKIGGASGAVAVAAGWSRVCVILRDGTVSCSRGGVRSVSPIEGVGPATALAVGPTHACATGREGRVWCWGQATYGAIGVSQEGRDAWDESAVLVEGLNDVVDVAAGEYHSCALHEDGRVSCWGMGTDPRITCTRGRNWVSCTGPSEATPHVPRPVAGFTEGRHIGAGGSQTCGVRGDGTVSCWDALEHGGDGDWIPRPVDGVAGARRVTVGEAHACALGDGTVQCWGDDERGALGQGDGSSASPLAGLGDIVDIAAGEHHTCAARRGGEVLCWGANEWGQLGDGRRGYDGSALVMPLSAVAEVEGGGELFCIRGEDGTVRCAGANDVGQLGDGTTEARPVLGPVLDLGRTRHLDLHSSTQGCAVDHRGTLRCWGDNTRLHAGRDFGAEPPVLVTPRRVEGLGLGAVAEVATTSMGTCALSRNGQVSCFGRRVWVHDDATHGPVPGLERATHLAGGEGHFCATLANGGVRCWGQDRSDALGGTIPPHESRNPNALVAVAGLDDATAVAAGCAFNCALRRDGTVACWGANGNGRLGPGHEDEHSSATPLTVEGISAATEVGAGCAHACARTADGTIRCWGQNDRGQLGSGGTSAAEGVVTLPVRGGLHVLDAGTCVDQGPAGLRCYGDVPGAAERGDQRSPVPVVGLPGLP